MRVPINEFVKQRREPVETVHWIPLQTINRCEYLQLFVLAQGKDVIKRLLHFTGLRVREKRLFLFHLVVSVFIMYWLRTLLRFY